MENTITIDIGNISEETAKMILAIAAERNISPNDAAKLVLNHAAAQAEQKPAA
jgi:hypothetical protein